MSLFLMRNNILESEYKYYYTGKLILKKSETESACQEVHIKKTGKILVLKFDKQEFSQPFFVKGKKALPNLNKMCDYILIYPKSLISQERLFVFLCELKSIDTKRADQQVKAGFHLAEYIIKTGLRLTNYPPYNIQYRALIFSKKVLKGTTKPENYKNYGPTLKYKLVQCPPKGDYFDIDAYCF